MTLPTRIVMWCIVVPLAILTLPVLLLFKLLAPKDHRPRLAAERSGEDIGTFALAFDRRAEPFDPWVVRATWDALQPYLVYRDGQVPLRPTDVMVGDLCIDPDDIELALFEEVAERSGHSLDAPEANPYFARISAVATVTVGDFVRFITWQPRIPAS